MHFIVCKLFLSKLTIKVNLKKSIEVILHLPTFKNSKMRKHKRKIRMLETMYLADRSNNTESKKTEDKLEIQIQSMEKLNMLVRNMY